VLLLDFVSSGCHNISIETVMLIRTANTIHLMVALTIHAFEDIKTRLSFFGSCLICFLVFHATLCFLSVIFSNVSFIALGMPGNMRTTTECWVALFPVVLILWNTWVHICATNSHNKSSNIKTTIDNVLHQRTALGIPDIYPNHCYIGFGRCFDDTWFWSQHDIFE